MDSSKNFVIAIGGTGMRCLESFVYMCAMGLYDGMEFDVLTLDTDFTNGNKQRTENLIKSYNHIKQTGDSDNGRVNNSTFFSAKINLFEFVTNYSTNNRRRFSELTKINADSTSKSDSKILAELFLSDEVQNFDLSHGYRAQTHLGSYLMYHAFIELARKLKKGIDIDNREKQFEEFLNRLYNAKSNARVFVLGSIFGGTGASSIPIIPKALDDAMKIWGDGKMSIDPNAKFASSLLTEYFKFTKPADSQKANKDNAIIADSSFFTLNSQAALQFYQSDPTVRSTYSKMYHIGWPIDVIDYSEGKDERQTITGGENQKNASHITELLCASAAWDFFHSNDLDQKSSVYLYKSVPFINNKLEFTNDDFIGDAQNGDFFYKKFSSFVSLMHLILTSSGGGLFNTNGASNLLQKINESIDDYSTLDDDYLLSLTNFFKQFGYSVDGEFFKPGWLYQIKKSVGGSMVIADSSYTTDLKILKKNKDKLPGNIHKDESYNWESKSFSGNTVDPFVQKMKHEKSHPKNDQGVYDKNERFIAHLYNAIQLSIKSN